MPKGRGPYGTHVPRQGVFYSAWLAGSHIARGVIHHALRGHVDAVRTAALRRVEYFHLAAARIEAAVNAALAGKPVHAVPVEDRGVEVGVPAAFGQRPGLHLA